MKKVTNDKVESFETLPDVLNVHQVRTVLGIGRVGVYKLIDNHKINQILFYIYQLLEKKFQKSKNHRLLKNR